VNTDDTTLPALFSGARERAILLLLCCLAAVHVFIFSAAFPLINNVDEQAHFDLVVKYSHGNIPCRQEPICREAMEYIVLYGSQEFIWPSETFPGGKYPPPPWTQPMGKIAPILLAREQTWQGLNHESSQPPLYYTLAGAWWRLGGWLGWEGGQRMYWLRFLNIPLVTVLIWLGHLAATRVFPENRFVKLGVPAIIAFMPPASFYSIQNDTLSALCFGAAFVCLINFFHAERPGTGLGVVTGLTLAAAFLTKIVNVPLLAVAVVMVSIKILNLIKTKLLRGSLPSVLALMLCAGIPAGLWMVWCKYNFGDFTGSKLNIKSGGVVARPFAEWWHHPIFTLQGLWTFVSDSLSNFWQGDVLWHNQPMTFSSVHAIYAVLSICAVVLALAKLCSRAAGLTGIQRQALWFSLACCGAVIVFWGGQSVIYDVTNCPNPTPKYPYIANGRYLLGAVIPFVLLFVFSMDRAAGRLGTPAKFLAVGGMIVFMLVSEIAADWPVFSSQYNWFHM